MAANRWRRRLEIDPLAQPVRVMHGIVKLGQGGDDQGLVEPTGDNVDVVDVRVTDGGMVPNTLTLPPGLGVRRASGLDDATIARRSEAQRPQDH